MARIAFSKIVIDAINKIKNDSKINNWKTIFIQYKSRCEKRKNWKEKTKLLKEIEDKMKLEAEELEDYKKIVDKNDDDDVELKTETPEDKVIEETTENKKVKKEETKSKQEKSSDATKSTEKVKKSEPITKIKFSDDESSDSETSSSDLDKKETKAKKENSKVVAKKVEKAEKAKKSEPIVRKVKFSDDESSDSEFNSDDLDSDSDLNEDDMMNSDYNENSDDDEENQDKDPIDLENVYVYSKANLTYNKLEEGKKLKPLVFENKPAHMVIKQINLDEIKDCSEIPIEPVNKVSESDEEEIKKSKENQYDFDENEISTIKIEQDPFFLDKDGNEVVNERLDRINSSSFRARPKHHDYDDDNLMSYSSYDKYKNKEEFRNRRDNLINSSFRSSLSSNYPPKYDRSTRNDYSNRDYKRKFNDDDNGFKRQRSMGDGRGFDNRNNFQRNDKFRSNGSSYNNNSGSNTDKPAMDVSKLHPSWQAKKLMEEKLKTIKFDGKKVKFDD